MKNSDAINFVNSLGSGSTFATLICDTEAKLISPKKINPQWIGLRKISYKLVHFNSEYGTTVGNQFEREGLNREDVHVKQRTNGLIHVEGSKVIMRNEDSTKFYLWVKYVKTIETAYVLNGEIIEPSKLDGVLYVPKSSSTQEPLEKKVIWFNLDLTNLIAIKCNGKIYKHR